ncbi:hypothetical protein [Maribacter sp. R86514]|uniref:hypothetical protein n=1 Tax=Maribacter sp. R86514 TaxID=3093854 RepID=UPI0037CB8B66
MTDNEKDQQLAKEIESNTKIKETDLQQSFMSMSIDIVQHFKKQLDEIENLDETQHSIRKNEIKASLFDFLINDSSMVKSINEPYRNLITKEFTQLSKLL